MGSVPSQGTRLRLGSVPSRGWYGRRPREVPRMDVSSLPLGLCDVGVDGGPLEPVSQAGCIRYSQARGRGTNSSPSKLPGPGNDSPEGTGGSASSRNPSPVPSADERFDATFHTNVLVNSSGHCQYLPPGEAASSVLPQ